MSILDDLGLEPGVTALARLARTAPVPSPAPPPETKPRYTLLTPDDLRKLPRMEWAVRSVLPARGIATIYGPSGSGKSFLQLDLIAAMAEGESWFGHIVPKALRVVVVVLEGEAGFRNRVEAWETTHGRTFPAGVRFVFQPVNLLERMDTLALGGTIDEAGGADVVVIDTLNRAMPGADENSSRDMSLMLDNSKELQAILDGLVIFVHHTGKDETRGMRGHSSLQGAIDAGIRVGRVDGQRQWIAEKVKEEEDGKSFPFLLEVVDLGIDADGEQVTSCVIRSCDAPTTAARRPPKGGNQRIIYDALGPLFKASSDFGKGNAPPMRPCLRLDDAIEATKSHLLVEAKRQAERARLAFQGLTAAGNLGHSEGWIWPR